MAFEPVTVTKPEETIPGEAVTHKARIILDPNRAEGVLHVAFAHKDEFVVELDVSDFTPVQMAKLEAFYNAVTAKAKAKIEGV